VLRQLHDNHVNAFRQRSISVQQMPTSSIQAAMANLGMAPAALAAGYTPQQVVTVHPYRSQQGSPQNSTTGGLMPSAGVTGSQQFALLNIPRSPTIDSVSVRSYGPALPPSTNEAYKTKAFR
jgi:hypothetical protein